MRRILILISAMMVSLGYITKAQTLTPYKGVVENGYDFWLYSPVDTIPDDPKPVVIFLHGSSLCGSDLNRVKRYGSVHALEMGRGIDAFVIAPQNPGGQWRPDKIDAVYEWVADHYYVDEDRVYVLGMSLGGYGTLDMVAAYPDKITAAMAFCGGSTSKNYEGMSKVPLWIVHGTGDSAVSVSQSDKVVEGIKATGDDSRLVYQRVPGLDHSKPARYFYLAETYDWLFSHSLKDRGRTVNREGVFDPALINDAYKDLGPCSTVPRPKLTETNDPDAIVE